MSFQKYPIKSIRVSIITCTKNSDEQYLKDCLKSVDRQRYKNYEHIIVDGYSSSETVSIIKKYLKQNNRAKLFQLPAKGISNAMNEGIKRSKGEYIYFLHSDDSLFDYDVLEKINSFLRERPDLDWFFGQICVVDKNKKTIGIFPKQKIFQGKHPEIIKFFNYVPHQGVFMHKEILKKYKFDETISSSMDLDLLLKISERTQWDYFPTIVANFRAHSSSQSSSKKNLAKNKQDYHLVKSRYLSRPEQIVSKLVYQISNKFNKTII